MQPFPNLTSLADGLDAYVAPPRAAAAAPTVIVLMEAFGLTQHVRNVCDRLAASGYYAVAPDLYRGAVYGDDDLDGAVQHMRGLRDEDVIKMLDTTIDALALRPGVDPERIAVLGFCMGGRLAFLAGCKLADRLAATIAFYGGRIAPEGEQDRFGCTPPIRFADRIQGPLLLIYGAEDQSIPPEEHSRIALHLSELGKFYTLTVYPGAGHGFLCEDRASYAPERAAQAFNEALAFLALTVGARTVDGPLWSGR